MESTTSISKGVFLFKNGFKPQRKSKKSKKDKNIKSDLENKLWYQSYKDLWNTIELQVQELNKSLFLNILQNLLDCLKKCYVNPVNEVPALALMTGINTEDNMEQFKTLSQKIKKDITPHVAILNSQDCNSVKSLVENVVSQFVNPECDSDDEYDDEDQIKKKIRKNQCTITYLENWYKENYEMSPNKRNKLQKKLLVIMFPEFESFQENAIQDFVLIASSVMNKLPIVLIFGVATSLSVLHKTFSYQISSKLFIHTFNSVSSTEHLNKILDNIILSNSNPFHLGGKAFSLFMDIFLFYDFSVTGFIQNFKFAMLQHFSSSEAMVLCTDEEESVDLIKKLPGNVLEDVRRLHSFRPYIEIQNAETRIKLLNDDNFLRLILTNHIKGFHRYLGYFHTLLRCFHILVEDLPRAPTGKQFRELYAIAVSKKLTETSEFKETVPVLKFISKDDLTIKINKICDLLRKSCENNDNKVLNDVLEKCIRYVIEIHETNFEYENSEQTEMHLDENVSREMLKQKLLTMAKQEKKQNNYEKFREMFVNDFTEVLDKYVEVPSSKPFHEIFFFNNISAVKNHIIGSHRAAIHTALHNPQYYLQCNCCNLPNESAMLPCLPDICIVYKLHLECGKLINMYDWLQAFVTIVEPDGQEEEDKTIDLKLQARFTRAVAELEFLGFIKTSKRKTDHVMRLTWGG